MYAALRARRIPGRSSCWITNLDVQRIRRLQELSRGLSFRESLLKSIDFIWFPTTALPLDPSEEGDDVRDALVERNGILDTSR
jgi:hypothetical protein